MTIDGTTETWEVDNPPLRIDFFHKPEGETGLCSTSNGTDFSNERYAIGGDSWKSLVKTEGLYSEIYWYVYNYAGTVVRSGHSLGDGEDDDDVFEHPFL